MTVTEQIQALKKEKNAVILAHYYVPDDVQEIADYIGDSFYLSKVAATTDADVLVLCGVSFMGESARILNPEKTVLLPDMEADCPMAHMADREKIQELKKQYEVLAVVCYINSTAELKTCADVCVTSANALEIVRALPNRHIFFIPDENLGRYVASKIPDKHFIFNDGHCPVHARLSREAVERAKKEHPGAEVLVHPECVPEVLALADYIGSTSGIIRYAGGSSCKSFIICTEEGVLCELKKRNPDRQFYMVTDDFRCPDMKKVTLDKVLKVLEEGCNRVEVDPELSRTSMRPLERMLELAR